MLIKRIRIALLLLALAGMLAIRWQAISQILSVNLWSVQYVQHAYRPTVKQSVLAAPPAGHARAALWLASDALRSGNPALADIFIASLASREDQLALDVASLLQVGSQIQQAGRQEEALMAYEAAWTLDPELGTLPLANFLLDSKKDYITAENMLGQSLATFPNSMDWPAWSRRLGDAFRAQKRWDEAAAAYKSAIVQASDNWAAYIGLGWTRYERGDGLQVAMNEFQKAIKEPESQGSGQRAIAEMLTRENRFEEADAWFVQALALNPEPWWYVERGNAAIDAKNLRLALRVYQEALARFPDYAWAYYEEAYAFQLNGQPAQAITDIEQALALMVPPNTYFYSRAGSIYEWAGDASRALQAYRQALLVDPQNVAAINGVKRLDK
jgi:tetratricopeptide (TPR) repeat protein